MDLWSITELGYFTRVTVIPNYYPLLEGIYAPSYKPPPGGGDFSTLAGAPTDNVALVSYIAAQIAALVGAAPSQLDTLNELATAIADDPNFASTITTQLGLKASSADLTAAIATLQAAINVNSASITANGTAIALKLAKASNLSDLADVPTARHNLGLLRLIPFWFGTAPTTSEMLAVYVANDAFTIPANFAGSQVKKAVTSGVNPTGAFVLSIRLNGVEFGTITIAADGTVTKASPAQAIAIGDIVTVHAPVTVDANIANWAINVLGAQ